MVWGSKKLSIFSAKMLWKGKPPTSKYILGLQNLGTQQTTRTLPENPLRPLFPPSIHPKSPRSWPQSRRGPRRSGRSRRSAPPWPRRWAFHSPRLAQNACFAVLGRSLLVAHLLLVAMPGAPSSFLFLAAMPGAPSSFLFLVAMPGAPSSFLVAMPGAPSSFLFLVAMPGAPSSFLFLVAMPGAPSSVLAPSSDARSPW